MRNAIIGMTFALFPFVVQAAGDVTQGAAVFKKCAACHNVDKPENKIGPYLMGVVGRKAGSVESYPNYSDAMKKAGDRGLVWDDENLAQYLAAPAKFIPGNRMPFSGLKSPDDIANLEAFLKGAAK